MGYQWDATKASANLRKHGVDFADAVGVFEDPFAATIDDPHPNEDRFVTIGQDLLGRDPCRQLDYAGGGESTDLGAEGNTC